MQQTISNSPTRICSHKIKITTNIRFRIWDLLCSKSICNNNHSSVKTDWHLQNLTRLQCCHKNKKCLAHQKVSPTTRTWTSYFIQVSTKTMRKQVNWWWTLTAQTIQATNRSNLKAWLPSTNLNKKYPTHLIAQQCCL